MEELFNLIYFKYNEVIHGFNFNLKTISHFEKKSKQANIYVENINLMLSNLKYFRENNYSNKNFLTFLEYKENTELTFTSYIEQSFNEVRKEFFALKNISEQEKNEILKKMEEMEEIIFLDLNKNKRWNRLRPYVIWISGKKLDIATRLLPLIFKLDLERVLK